MFGFLPPPPPHRRELAAFTMASVSKWVIFPSHIDTFLFNSGSMEHKWTGSLFPKKLETAIRNEIWLRVPLQTSLTGWRSAVASVASVCPIYTQSWHHCNQINYCLLGQIKQWLHYRLNDWGMWVELPAEAGLFSMALNLVLWPMQHHIQSVKWGSFPKNKAQEQSRLFNSIYWKGYKCV